jgi:PAS domain S-box-containing protein
MFRALDLSKMLVIGLDACGRIRLFSAEAERVTGYPRDEVLDARFVDLLVPEAMRETHGAALEQIALGRRRPGDVMDGVIATRSGEIRHVCWLVAYEPPERDDDVVLFMVGHDTSERRARERRARGREKVQATGSLVAGLAHEIRNPLNGAHLHATVLERVLKRAGIVDEEVLSAVGVVQGEIHRLSQLVNDFLDFARPQLPDVREASLRAICERALARTARLAASSGVEVRAELPPADEVIEADPGRMQLALNNLLSNAIEAAGASGGAVVLRAERRADGAIMEVEDNGPGVLDPDAPIFDPFYSTKPNGTGLGLAIVQRVAADHEGVVELDTRPGRTVFRLRLPVTVPAGVPADARRSRRAGGVDRGAEPEPAAQPISRRSRSGSSR